MNFYKILWLFINVSKLKVIALEKIIKKSINLKTGFNALVATTVALNLNFIAVLVAKHVQIA